MDTEIKIKTVVSGDTVTLSGPDQDGDLRLAIVGPFKVTIADVWLAPEQVDTLIDALTKLRRLQ